MECKWFDVNDLFRIKLISEIGNDAGGWYMLFFIVLALFIIRTIIHTISLNLVVCYIEMVIMVMRFNWSHSHTQIHVLELMFTSIVELCATQVFSAIHLLFIWYCYWLWYILLTWSQLRTNAQMLQKPMATIQYMYKYGSTHRIFIPYDG